MGAGQSTNPRIIEITNRLLTEYISPTEAKFWDELCNAPTSKEDVWNVFTLDLIRRGIYAQPLNFATLLKGLLLRVQSIVDVQNHIPNGNDPSNKDVLVKAGTMSTNARKHVEANAQLLLNCIRILTRIIAVVHESEQELPPSDDLSNAEAIAAKNATIKLRIQQKQQFRQWIWGGNFDVNEQRSSISINSATASTAETSQRNSIVNEKSITADVHTTENQEKSSADSQVDEWFIGKLNEIPLGILLMRLMTECLFLETFTIGTPQINAVNSAGIHLGKLWEFNGEIVGLSHVQQTCHNQTSASVLPNTRYIYDARRCEVLRCILTCISGAMFVKIEEFVPHQNQYIEALTDYQNNQLSLTLFYSLFNTVLHHEYTTVTMFSGSNLNSEMRNQIVNLAIQVLLVTIDCNKLLSEEEDLTTESNQENHRTIEEQIDSVTELIDDDDSNQPNPAAFLLSPGMKPHQHKERSSNVDDTLESESDESPSKSDSSSTTDAKDPEEIRTTQSSSSAKAAKKHVSFGDYMSPKVEIINSKIDQPENETDQQIDDRSKTTDQNDSPRKLALDSFFNSWAVTLSTLQPRSMTITYQHLSRLILASSVSSNTFLSTTSVYDSTSEFYILLWKLLDYNPNFMHHILSQPHECQIYNLLTAVLLHMYQGRHEPSLQGLSYTCVFILLKLSGAREFAIQLNRNYPFEDSSRGGSNPIQPTIAAIPLKQIDLIQKLNIGPMLSQLPPSADSTLTYGDLLILTCHALIMSDNNQLDALIKVLLTALNNVSPYLTRVSVITSVKLLSLFETYSNQSFLLQSPQHIVYLNLVISIFNNLIQYQSAGCAHLIYNIVRRSSPFYDLGRNYQQNQTSNRPLQPTGDDALVTDEWLAKEKSQLPLEVILRLLDFFLPLISRFVSHHGVQRDESGLIDFIRQSTLVGVLPPAGPVIVRKYISNIQTNQWFSSFLFGLIFLKTTSQFSIFARNYIRLFVISTQYDELDSLFEGTGEIED